MPRCPAGPGGKAAAGATRFTVIVDSLEINLHRVEEDSIPAGKQMLSEAGEGPAPA